MSDIQSIIRSAAAQYGLDPDMMVRIANIESSLNPNSAHPQSSARGLYQFMTAPGGSWQEYGRGGDALDPAANADAGMRYTLDNQKYLKSVLGRDPTPGETYLAHQQGRAGAAALLANPDTPAVDAIRRFYKNPQTASDAITLNGGRPDMTAGEFAAKWTVKLDGNGNPVTQTPQAANPQAPQMPAYAWTPGSGQPQPAPEQQASAAPTGSFMTQQRAPAPSFAQIGKMLGLEDPPPLQFAQAQQRFPRPPSPGAFSFRRT